MLRGYVAKKAIDGTVVWEQNLGTMTNRTGFMLQMMMAKDLFI